MVLQIDLLAQFLRSEPAIGYVYPTYRELGKMGMTRFLIGAGGGTM
jgi:hypothetical protein